MVVRVISHAKSYHNPDRPNDACFGDIQQRAGQRINKFGNPDSVQVIGRNGENAHDDETSKDVVAEHLSKELIYALEVRIPVGVIDAKFLLEAARGDGKR